MNKEELMDALDGIHAYDVGCVDSGIHDELLRRRCYDQLSKMNRESFINFFVEFFWENYLNEKAKKQGYSEEDVSAFCEWIYNENIEKINYCCFDEILLRLKNKDCLKQVAEYNYKETMFALKEIDKHPIIKGEKDDWCDLDPKDDQTVVFYRKDGSPFLMMPLDVYDQLKIFKKSK